MEAKIISLEEEGAERYRIYFDINGIAVKSLTLHRLQTISERYEINSSILQTLIK